MLQTALCSTTKARAADCIRGGLQEKTYLGNLDAERDWRHETLPALTDGSRHSVPRSI
jgi:hypothetical protein